jgi:hypothetical protein
MMAEEVLKFTDEYVYDNDTRFHAPGCTLTTSHNWESSYKACGTIGEINYAEPYMRTEWRTEREREGFKFAGTTYVGASKTDDSPASSEKPVYKKVSVKPDSNLFMIICDEGWRTLIVCDNVYENVADWLLDILGRTPYAKKVE